MEWISSSGLIDFNSDVKALGGLKNLARTNYMRNLWAIMKTFKVLPTDPNFLALTDAQIDLMIHSMNEDAREAELARKGLTVDSEHYDSSFEDDVWNKDDGEWDVLREGHDADKIAQQVQALTRKEDQSNLDKRFDGLDEYNEYREAGGKTSRETEVEQYMNKRLEEAYEKARDLDASRGSSKLIDDKDRPEAKGALGDNMANLDKEAIEQSIALFNSDDDDFDAL